MELKNIGSTMGVFYVQPGAVFSSLALDKGAFAEAGKLFEAWDEDLGQSYFFLPYFPHKEVEPKNHILKQLKIGAKLVGSPKGILFQGPVQGGSSLDTLESRMSFLFGLVVLFGKWERKGEQLNAVKLHLPLFGQYLQIADRISGIIGQLQQDGIFLQSSTNQHQGQISYQITSNDRELLQIFAEWYKDVENMTKITKKELVAQAVEQVKVFLVKQDIENREEVEALLKWSTVKILVKN